MTLFELGPDQGGDIRRTRPYFLVPLLESASNPTHYVDRIASAIADKRYSDIYVLCHGWHRNLFSAVTAYDRLISRFTELFQRGRLTPPPGTYNPLFVAFHWNSDPTEDGWMDAAGHRDKTSFTEKMGALFEPGAGTSEGEVSNVFEDLFEFFTYVSAPDIPALKTELDDRAKQLLMCLNKKCDVRGRLSEGQPVTPAEKAALAWRCYAEATPLRVLADQREQPARFNNPFEAVADLGKFLVAVLGLSVVLGIFRTLVHWVAPPKIALSILAVIRSWTPRLAVRPFWSWLHVKHGVPDGLAFFLALLPALTVTAVLLLVGAALLQHRHRPGTGGRGLPVIAVGSWAPLQVLFLLPLLFYSFVTFIFRTWIVLLAPAFAWFGGWPLLVAFLTVCVVVCLATGWHRGFGLDLFNERARFLPSGATWDVPRARAVLAWLARLPLRLFRHAVAQDSQAWQWGEAVDNQLAFWQMQRKGVQAGDAAGEFVLALSAELTRRKSLALPDARMHLIGHSFGGLVVVNLARRLALAAGLLARGRTSPTSPVGSPVPANGPRLHTLCLLQAALASAWFEGEHWSRNRDFLSGTLACIYSGYDTANGFYYPFANNGRMAAGYVGMYRVGQDTIAQTLGKDGLFASLVQPPDLNKHVKGNVRPYALNLDASRLIYAGSPAVGGGHDDIFKDDVVHLIWALATL